MQRWIIMTKARQGANRILFQGYVISVWKVSIFCSIQYHIQWSMTYNTWETNKQMRFPNSERGVASSASILQQSEERQVLYKEELTIHSNHLTDEVNDCLLAFLALLDGTVRYPKEWPLAECPALMSHPWHPNCGVPFLGDPPAPPLLLSPER